MPHLLEKARSDWQFLDSLSPSEFASIRIVSHECFTKGCGFEVEHIEEPCFVRMLHCLPLFHAVFRALQLLLASNQRTVLVVDGRTFIWMFCGLFNRLLFSRRRTILVWGLMVEVNKRWKQKLYQIAIRGVSLAPLWSRAQIETHSQFLKVSKDKFIFLPYKANHSKHSHYNLPTNRFVFSGGNGKRDYQTLVDAIRGTNIQLFISATNRCVRDKIELLPNVVVLAAWEPAFAQLQASSMFSIIAMQDTGLKGGGEANMCNAMWHGKAVIAMDRLSAPDYIQEGVTGFIVPPGDTELLRKRIIQLWNDQGLCQRMGANARKYVEDNLTHDKFIGRLLKLAALCCDSTTAPPRNAERN